MAERIIARLLSPADSSGTRKDIHLVTNSDEVIVDDNTTLTEKLNQLGKGAIITRNGGKPNFPCLWIDITRTDSTIKDIIYDEFGGEQDLTRATLGDINAATNSLLRAINDLEKVTYDDINNNVAVADSSIVFTTNGEGTYKSGNLAEPDKDETDTTIATVQDLKDMRSYITGLLSKSIVVSDDVTLPSDALDNSLWIKVNGTDTQTTVTFEELTDVSGSPTDHVSKADLLRVKRYIIQEINNMINFTDELVIPEEAADGTIYFKEV